LTPTGLTDAVGNNRLNPVTTCQRPFRIRHVTGRYINNISDSISLLFSTGAVISGNTISGRIAFIEKNRLKGKF